MKRTVLLAVPLGGVLLVLACGRPGKDSLDPMGPNAACYVCHMTFVRETISKAHAAEGVGCIKCHGTSAAHANDEDVGATKPDRFYTRAQVNPACRACHPKHDVAPEKLVAQWQAVCVAKFKSKPPAEAACTDCHGTHHIARAK